MASALYLANSHSQQAKYAWIYWVGPAFGALAGVVLAEVLSPLSGGALDVLEETAAGVDRDEEAGSNKTGAWGEGQEEQSAAAGGGIRSQ